MGKRISGIFKIEIEGNVNFDAFHLKRALLDYYERELGTFINDLRVVSLMDEGEQEEEERGKM